MNQESAISDIMQNPAWRIQERDIRVLSIGQVSVPGCAMRLRRSRRLSAWLRNATSEKSPTVGLAARSDFGEVADGELQLILESGVPQMPHDAPQVEADPPQPPQ